MVDLQQQIEKFEKARDELKAATREAHSAFKALRDERREVDALRKELVEVAEQKAIEMIQEALGPKLKSFGTELGEHQQLMLDSVMNAFTVLLHTLVEGKPKGSGDSVIAVCEELLKRETEKAKERTRMSWLDG